jgi:HD-like signal output (HDOD) protein
MTAPAAGREAAVLSTLEGQWVSADLPVLQYTREQILLAAQAPDDVDLNRLASLIASDPLMTLRVLKQASAPHRGLMHNAPRTALEALMLLGTGPFFRACSTAPVVQDLLANEPDALAGLTAAMARAYRAARLAHRFASMLDDPDAEVIHEVTLLHSFAELLLWVFRPRLALATLRPQGPSGHGPHPRALHDLPIDLMQLGLRLMHDWRLHPQLIRLIEHHHSPTGRAHLIDLAVRIAEDAMHGEPDRDSRHLADAASTLQLSIDAARQVLRQL